MRRLQRPSENLDCWMPMYSFCFLQHVVHGLKLPDGISSPLAPHVKFALPKNQPYTQRCFLVRDVLCLLTLSFSSLSPSNIFNYTKRQIRFSRALYL